MSPTAYALTRWRMPPFTFLLRYHPSKLLKPSILNPFQWLLKQTHTSSFHPNLKPYTTHISTFMNSGHLHSAHKVFDEMHHKNPITYNAMIHRHFQYQSPSSPNLKPYHTQISILMKSGHVQSALKVFDEMPVKNTITYNAMIRGLFQNNSPSQALDLFRRTPNPDIFSYNSVIAGLMRHGDVTAAKTLFKTMPFTDVVSWNSMLSGYILNGFLDQAVFLFDTMANRDVVSWTIMVSGFVDAGLFDEARTLFEQMPVKDTRAWNKMIEGCVKKGEIELAVTLFRAMPEHDFESWRVLITGLIGSNRINDAVRLFFEMENKCLQLMKMVVLGLVKTGLVKPAHAVLEKMLPDDLVCSTNLIVGYFGAFEVDSALKIFESMVVRDVAVWNATIFGLCENDRGEEGVKLFIRMKESGNYPDVSTFTSVLKICAKLPSLELGEQTHGQVVKSGFVDMTAISNAMVTMYSRCGKMGSALFVFESMENRNLISWNSIICGYSNHGDGEKAVEMFENMIRTDVKPNHITFIGVLSACCHAGMVEKGRLYFGLMSTRYLVKPAQEHFTCMVDMLGKNGLLKEALAFLEQMKQNGENEITGGVWGALLGACRMHKEIGIGEMAGLKVLETEPWNAGTYRILAEMYLENGRVVEAERILAKMKALGVKKQPGCSWIEVSNRGHVFLAGDSTHPRFDRIRVALRLVYWEGEGLGRSLVCDEPELIVYGV